MRGLFEADGTVAEGVPSVSTASPSFADDIRTVLLALGYPTTTRTTPSGWGGPIQQVRVRNVHHAYRFGIQIGFMGGRKSSLVADDLSPQSGNKDRIHLPDAAVAGVRSCRDTIARAGAAGRATGPWRQPRRGRRLLDATGDPRLAHALGYLYETVESNEDGGVQPTYDLSVPDNVTYVGGGFVSHNTIGLMMDCDTTGIEPDLALVKFKKLVGGGSMQIVNLTIPRALRKMGYTNETVEAIVEFIADKGHVIDAPGLKPEHYEVFDTAMGERSISAMGHVRMMAAAQPFLSGAISKTVNLPEDATVEEIEDVYLQGWKLGLKATGDLPRQLQGRPAAVRWWLDRQEAARGGQGRRHRRRVETVIEYRPVRKRLPKRRPSQTISFSVGGAEGYLTAGSYPDDGLGEVFLKFGKQGSTLGGVMDAFSIAVSIGLQYGVPLETFVEKFTNLRFEPAGLTDDPDIRMAQSIMDYVFRRLALDYMDFETRSSMGIHSADERMRQLETGSYAEPVDSESDEDVSDELEGFAQSAQLVTKAGKPAEAKAKAAKIKSGSGAASAKMVEGVHSSAELMEKFSGKSADAPICLTCGTKMRPAGSCYVCEGCGSTSGCS